MPPLNRLNKIAVAIALSQAVALPINAATISVDTTDDTQVTGTCSLRSAIEAANNNEVVLGCVAGSVTGNDTIDLTGLSNGSTITLTEPLPTVVSTVTINGSGQNNLSISGANQFPILKVENADLTVSGITLTEARDISREPGGAISTDNSRLTINDSTLSENNAEEGAGVYSNNSSVIVNNSTISNNEAESGGAIYFSSRSILDINSSLEINNSTLSGNYAHIHGGAIDSVVSSIIINNSTISNNSAGADSGGMFSTSRTLSITNSTITGNVSNTRAGGINVASDFLNISNNIISGNASSTNITSEISVRFSFFSSTRNNLFGSNQVSDSEAFDGFILSSGNIIATSNELNIPLSDIIAPLADNGGDTLTHALVENSPAIDAGNNSTCLATDQRGEPRNDNLCDIGSYEVEVEEAETFFVIPLEDEKAVVIPL